MSTLFLVIGAAIIVAFVIGVIYALYRLAFWLFGNRNGNPRN